LGAYAQLNHANAAILLGRHGMHLKSLKPLSSGAEPKTGTTVKRDRHPRRDTRTLKTYEGAKH